MIQNYIKQLHTLSIGSPEYYDKYNAVIRALLKQEEIYTVLSASSVRDGKGSPFLGMDKKIIHLFGCFRRKTTQ